MVTLEITKETYDLHTSFSISRGANNSIDVVTVKISDKNHTGQGECRPYARYNETPESVVKEIESIRTEIENNPSRLNLLNILPAGAARNAVDCALWDLEAKQKNQSVWNLIGGEGSLQAVSTVQSLSLASPAEMAKTAATHMDYKTLKIKLGGDEEDIARLKSIQMARPDAEFIVDANEGWNFEQLKIFVDQAQNLNVTMIEQPLAKDKDEVLLGYDSGSILICGDESIHNIEDLKEKADLYSMINIKLDKSGGLTHALEMCKTLETLNNQGKNIQLMIGCMVCTSLAIEPHIILAQNCDLADLDGPWWLKEDRKNGVKFIDGKVISGTLWG